MRQSRVGWSNCREKGRIEAMKQCSFQSRLVKNSFYFAQELVSLSTAGIYRSLASRNSLLPSSYTSETLLQTGQEEAQQDAEFPTSEHNTPLLEPFSEMAH